MRMVASIDPDGVVHRRQRRLRRRMYCIRYNYNVYYGTLQKLMGEVHSKTGVKHLPQGALFLLE